MSRAGARLSPATGRHRRVGSLGAAAALAASAVLLCGPVRAETVRTFAVGHKVRVDDAVDVAAFRAKIFALVDAQTRPAPPAEPLVEPGIDDVASHLAPLDPGAPARAVVHFPEDTGLVAGLIGSRGAQARIAPSAVLAFASLLNSYQDVTAFYVARFPDLASQPIRALVVALTDVLYRSVWETFRDVAVTYRIHVSVSLNVAAARRVTEAEDAELVARLRDPDEPQRDYAYLATSDLPHNVVWLFEPSGEVLTPDGRGGLLRSPSQTGGEIRASSAKAYLTPIEQGLDKPGGGLSLAAGAVRDLDVLDTAVGAFGVVISKDAWMPDVNERFDAKGARITLQSEAFSSWGYAPEPWDPDIFKESGFAHLGKHPGFLFNAAPCLTGNLLDVTFDGQTSLLERRRIKPGPATRTDQNAWIGQPADSGFVRIGPWILPDPPAPETRPSAYELIARRQALAAAGVKLLPGSGVACAGPLTPGACENGYRETVIFADLDVPLFGAAPPAPAAPAARRPTSFGQSVAVAPGGERPQRHPRVIGRGRRVLVAWDEPDAGGVWRVWVAASRDGGRSFAAPRRASPDDGQGDERYPAWARRGDSLLLVWQASLRAGDDDSGAIWLGRFDWSGKRLDPRATRVDDGATVGGTAAEAGRWMPAIDVDDDGTVAVVWIDERDRGPDGVALEHVYAARAADATARRFAPSVRVDSGTPTPLAAPMDNRWSPTIQIRSGVIRVAWADFRDYNWDIAAAHSTDGGATFTVPARVNDYSGLERLCDSPRFLPRPGPSGAGPFSLVWTDLRAREPNTTLMLATSRDDGATFGSNRRLDDGWRVPGSRPPPNASFASLASAGAQAVMAWQDDRAGNPDIYFAPVNAADVALVGGAERVDDTGSAASHQGRPDLTTLSDDAGATCVVVWEDDREGAVRVYTAARRCLTAR